MRRLNGAWLTGVLLLANLILTASPLPAEENTGEVHGAVITDRGDKISGAQVTLNGLRIGGVSEYGHYHITNVPVGERLITVSLVGYETVSKTVTILAGRTVTADFLLKSRTIDLDPLVVTGTRTIRHRSESPVQVNVVPPEQFDLGSSVNLAEGIALTPGVRVESNCQNCNYTQVRLNGLEGPYTQILLNGRPTVSSLASIYGLEQIPSSMIERLEVVKGGGSSLYGGAAVGGVVNVITRRPQIEGTNMGLKLGWLKGSPDRTLSLNTTVLSDDRRLGLFMFGQNRERNPVEVNGDGFSEMPHLKSLNFGGQAFFAPDDRRELTMELHVLSEYRRGGDQVTGTRPHEAFIAEWVETRRLGGGVNYSHRVNAGLDWSAYGSFAYTGRESYYGTQFYNRESDSWSPNYDAYGSSLNPVYMSGAQFNYRPSLKHTISAGAELVHEHLEDGIPSYGFRVNEDYLSGGVFIQDDWQALPNLNAVIGLRLDGHSTLGSPIASPRAAVLLSLSENLALRGSYSSGFRPPALLDADLHVAQVGGEGVVTYLDPDLKEEKSHSFSGGIEYDRTRGSDRSYYLSGSGFVTLLRDIFAERFDRREGHTEYHVRRNSGGARVHGVEIGGGLTLGDRFWLRGGWTVQRSRYDRPLDISVEEDVEILERDFLRTPNLYGFVSGSVEVLRNLLDLDLSLDLTGPMKVHNGATNRLRRNTGWFGVLDARFNWRLSGMGASKLFLHAHNVFDSYQKDLERVRLGGPEPYLRDTTYFYGPTRPRSFYLGIETGF